MRTGTDGQVNDIWRFGEIVVTYKTKSLLRKELETEAASGCVRFGENSEESQQRQKKSAQEHIPGPILLFLIQKNRHGRMP